MPASGVTTAPGVADPPAAEVTAFPALAVVGWRPRTTPSRVLRSLLLHAVLIALATLMVLPLVWTASTSLKSPGDAYAFPPEWLPSWPFYWENYTKGFSQLPFGVFYRNTAFLTVAATVGATVSSALVGYAFARYRAPGSNVVFTILLATMMIPFQVTMIPQFILFKNLGWVNTFLPLIVPYWLGGGAFYIFLLRQFLRTIPTDFDSAVFSYNPAARVWFEWQPQHPLSVLVRLKKVAADETIAFLHTGGVPALFAHAEAFQ